MHLFICHIKHTLNVGTRSGDCQLSMRYGMGERQCAGMERDAAVGIAARCTVLEVAFDRTADVCQLATYLVVAAGMQVNLQKGVAPVADTDNTIVERRKLSPTSTLRHNATLVVHLILYEPVLQSSYRLCGRILDDSPVTLAKVTLLDHLCHAAQRLGSLGEQDNAADWTVEPMYDTTEDIARLAVALFDIGLHKVSKRHVAGLVALRNLAWELVERQQVVVFVEYLVSYQGVRGYRLWVMEIGGYMMSAMGLMPFFTRS